MKKQHHAVSGIFHFEFSIFCMTQKPHIVRDIRNVTLYTKQQRNNPITLMPKTITKRDIVMQIHSGIDNELTQATILDIIQQTIDIIADSLAQGNRIVLRNFGTLHVKEVKAKVGRNPKDPGKDVPIPARMVVKFKVGKELRDRVSHFTL